MGTAAGRLGTAGAVGTAAGRLVRSTVVTWVVSRAGCFKSDSLLKH